jgi:hypothetical protein
MSHLFGGSATVDEKTKSVLTTPILADDGSIRVADGYDKVSGLWAHDIPLVAVAARATKDEASRHRAPGGESHRCRILA